MPSIETLFHLPPGPVTAEYRLPLLQELFQNTPVFIPQKYGRIDGDELISSNTAIETLNEFWNSTGVLTVTGKPASQFISILPNKADDLNWNGTISWCVPASKVNKKWIAWHAEKVAAIMHIIKCPIAYAATHKDLEAKTWHWIDDPIGGQRREPTVRSPKEGFPGMFWRFFMADSTAKHWSTLDQHDNQYINKLKNNVVMLSPYDDPDLAGTEQGIASENAIIDLMGIDYFYNHESRTAPTKFPPLK